MKKRKRKLKTFGPDMFLSCCTHRDMSVVAQYNTTISPYHQIPFVCVYAPFWLSVQNIKSNLAWITQIFFASNLNADEFTAFEQSTNFI